MIISQTPLRMSFVGGGTDLPAFYRKHGGAVVSTAVGAYVYVTVNKKFDDWIRVSYSKTEEVASPDQLEHKIVRAVLGKLGISGGIEITSIADIPSRGTGLGSSSAFTVGLLHALHAYQGRHVSARQLGEESCHVEIDLCGDILGKQDQYAAAFGGLNFISFNPDDSVVVEPVICRPDVVNALERDTIAFYTGKTRSATPILAAHSQAAGENPRTQQVMLRMKELARILREELQNSNAAALGEIVHENWMLKKEISSEISNDGIDDWYRKARAAGATGGKLLGAGGGGFLVFCAPQERHEAIARALGELRQVSLPFEKRGSRILLVH